MFRLFSKTPKQPPEMNSFQRAIFMHMKGFFGRKSRKYYLKGHSSEGLTFESQKVKDAVSRLCTKQ